MWHVNICLCVALSLYSSWTGCQLRHTLILVVVTEIHHHWSISTQSTASTNKMFFSHTDVIGLWTIKQDIPNLILLIKFVIKDQVPSPVRLHWMNYDTLNTVCWWIGLSWRLRFVFTDTLTVPPTYSTLCSAAVVTKGALLSVTMGAAATFSANTTLVWKWFSCWKGR